MHGSSEKSLIRPSRSQGFHDLPELARSNTNLVLERPRFFGIGLNELDCRASVLPQRNPIQLLREENYDAY